MNYFKLSFLLLFATIIFFGATALVVNKDIYKDAKTSQSCSTKTSTSSKTCGIWQDDSCLKGICNDDCTLCTKKPDYSPLILSILGLVSLVLFIIFTILGFVKK